MNTLKIYDSKMVLISSYVYQNALSNQQIAKELELTKQLLSNTGAIAVMIS
jgi:predicted XRE-type DNA-binding protein